MLQDKQERRSCVGHPDSSCKPKLTACRVDTEYCSGTQLAPSPNNKFAALSYSNRATSPPASVNIKAWIQGIRGDSASDSKDLLSAFDESIDASIGGLKGQTEKMYNSQRSVPLFEFRDLEYIDTTKFETFMDSVDSSIQDLHKDFANSP